MTLLNIFNLTLPLENPVLKFFLILVIILFATIILNKLRIPHILGLIIAGAIIGPNGLNLIIRDSSIILSGTAGLLYIMFLAGLEMDMGDFKKNSTKSIIFGAYTFIIPMILGTLTGIYIFHASLLTSILLASMFASHTLITYPIITKLGVTKNRAVNITIGGTIITDTLSLLVLAIIVGITKGEITPAFWFRLTISIISFGLFVIYVFPIIASWFFKKFRDKILQYIFVLAMVFLSAILAEIAGIEAIIGAFLAGLALNKLIPNTSPLMNRVEFVGNAIFIPFFLIGVGMLVDYQVFFDDFETIKVAIIMTFVATLAKFIAAWLTQKTFKFTADERRLIFGLSNAQAAATLAAVLIGYNIVTGYDVNGEPIRLLSEYILNGTIVMILITCTIASFVTQKGAGNISLLNSMPSSNNGINNPDKTLISVSNPETIDELIGLSSFIKPAGKANTLYAVNIVNNSNTTSENYIQASEMLDKAVVAAASTDVLMKKILHYDQSVASGIASVIDNKKINTLISGIHFERTISQTFIGSLIDSLVSKTNVTTLIYKPVHPFSTIKRHLVIIPANAEKEIGFPFWVGKIWNIAKNSGGKIVFYGADKTIKLLTETNKKHTINAEFKIFNDLNELDGLSKIIKSDDNLIFVFNRNNKQQYHKTMRKISHYLNTVFLANSFILIFPIKTNVKQNKEIDLKNPSLNIQLERLDEIGNTILDLFKKK